MRTDFQLQKGHAGARDPQDDPGRGLPGRGLPGSALPGSALPGSDAWLASIVDSSDDAIISKDLDGIIMSWNRSAEQLFGYPAREAIGRPLTMIIPPERCHEEDMILAHLRRGERIDHYETVRLRKDGTVVDVSITVSPVKRGDGTIVGASKIARDIGERKRAAEELRRSEERFRSSIVKSPVPTILYDDQERILAVSRSWIEAAGGSARTPERMEDLTRCAFGEGSGAALALIREIIATEPEERVDELTVRTRRGDRRIFNFVTSGVGAMSDGRRLFVWVAQDLTDRKAYEERIEILMREARHRTKNVLALVQAIARQTARGGDEEAFVDRFTGRIRALAANQDLLVQHEWQKIDINELVLGQLQHFADLIGPRIHVEGARLELNATAAQTIGLALHELATNAGKYGALSTDAGHVDVRWHVDGDAFTMSWTERDGPVVRPPRHRGFGTTVTDAMVRHTLQGVVELSYPPSGLAWRLRCHAADALENAA